MEHFHIFLAVMRWGFKSTSIRDDILLRVCYILLDI